MAEEDISLHHQRGDYGRNWGPTLFLALGRVGIPPLLYWLTKKHPLGALGVPPPPTGNPPIELLGQSFPRLPFLMASMSGVLSTKIIIWLTTYHRERLTLRFAFFGVVSNVIYESITTLVFTAAAKNPMFSERLFYPAWTLYVSSVALELIAELQRMAFKRNRRNEGKPCTTGFWAISRHINYTANMLYGFGFGLAAGGPIYACMTGGMYLSNFVFNALPAIEEYCRKKYGKEWERYEKKVPYQLIPGIY